MTETITRCPKCATSFRITQVHLKSAKGSVRCGSCLSIFNATDNLVTPEPSVPLPAPEIPDHQEETASQEKENTFFQSDAEDDVLISDDMERQNTEEFNMGENFYLPETANVPESNLFEREVMANKDDPFEEDDDSWALNLLEEKDDDEQEDDTDQKPEEKPTQDTSNAILDNSASLDNENSLSDFNSLATPEHEADTAKQEPNQATFDKNHDKDKTQDASPAQPVFDFYDEEEDEQEDSHYDFINAIEPEPVEFSYKKNRTFWLSNGFLGGISLTLILLLAGQIAWFKFDTLSTIKPYRGFYAHACQVLGCELPKLVNLDKIRINQLLVRTHPSEKNALIVDAIILNNASFSQPFPNLALAFSDINNNLVAHRIFTPKEYIKGELAGRSSMPSLQPISLSFQIVDPGENAVNYLLTLSQ